MEQQSTRAGLSQFLSQLNSVCRCSIEEGHLFFAKGPLTELSRHSAGVCKLLTDLAGEQGCQFNTVEVRVVLAQVSRFVDEYKNGGYFLLLLICEVFRHLERLRVTSHIVRFVLSDVSAQLSRYFNKETPEGDDCDEGTGEASPSPLTITKMSLASLEELMHPLMVIAEGYHMFDSQADQQYFVADVVKAFIGTLPSKVHQVVSVLDYRATDTRRNIEVHDSLIFKFTLSNEAIAALARFPPAPGESPSVLLFDVSLIPAEGAPEAYEIAFCTRLVSLCARHGVRVLMSQKLIHGYLQCLCAHQGIVTVERLALTYIDQVRQLTGATVISNVNFFDDEYIKGCLGKISTIEMVHINEQPHLKLTPAPGAEGMVTVVLFAGTETEGKLKRELFGRCFATLRLITTDNSTVPAGWLRGVLDSLAEDLPAQWAMGTAWDSTGRLTDQFSAVLGAFCEGARAALGAFEPPGHLSGSVLAEVEYNTLKLALEVLGLFCASSWDTYLIHTV